MQEDNIQKETDNKKISGKRMKIVDVLFLVLAAVAVISLIISIMGRQGDVQEDTLTVYRGEEAVAVFSYEEICAMASVTFEKNIVSGSQADESGSFTGVPLRDILEAADEAFPEDCRSVSAAASDGFMTAFSAEELLADDSICVVWQKDGRPLEGRAEGGSGPLRIVAAEDSFGNRSVKYLVSLTVEE